MVRKEKAVESKDAPKLEKPKPSKAAKKATKPRVKKQPTDLQKELAARNITLNLVFGK